MSRTRKRESNITFSKDQMAITDREIARWFNDNDGRLFFRPCAESERFTAAVDRVMDGIFRPLGIKLEHWRQLVWLRMRALLHQGLLRFGSRGNVVFFGEKQMKKMVMQAEAFGRNRGMPKAYRHGRRNYVNTRQALRSLAAF